MSDDLATPLTISLTRAEVLVLGHCLDATVDHAFDGKIIDEAERQALWGIRSTLEQVCADSFRSDYPTVLQQSKLMMGDFSK